MSILEIMITLSIISLLALACFSSYGRENPQKQLDQASSQFIQNLEYAKQISTLTHHKIILCASVDHQTCNPNWHGDIVIFNGDSPPDINQILQISPGIPNDVDFSISLGSTTSDSTFFYFTNHGSTVSPGKFSFSKKTATTDIVLKYKIDFFGIVRKETSD